METYEQRYCEIRRDGDRALTGTVVRYGDEANIGGVFVERILPGALVVADDAVLNRQHDRSLPLVRMGFGLEVRDDAQSLTLRAVLPQTTVANDALEMVQAGLLRGFSLEMVVREDTWKDQADKPFTMRTISRAHVAGIGLVDKPAYPQSSVEARQAAIKEFVEGYTRFPMFYL